MRGWIHLYAFAVSIVGGIVLCSLAASRPGWSPLASCAVYAVTSCGLFGISALYAPQDVAAARLCGDETPHHAMIFIFIAGTYTPFTVILLPARTAEILLGVVWISAVAGATMKIIWPTAPRWLAVPLYLAIGWAAVVVLPDMMTSGGVAALVLLATGGLTYTVGAVFYATKWPNPWPRVFGHHRVLPCGHGGGRSLPQRGGVSHSVVGRTVVLHGKGASPSPVRAPALPTLPESPA